jgi:serine/threonine protein kinase
MSMSSGTRLGPYEIVAAIGAGGMGEVYKARDTRLNRTVAIKILPESLASDPQFRERFDREARAISQLTHPHICTLYDVGEGVGTAFLVMEYLEGETLEQRLKKGAMPLDEALKIATQIADAFSASHRQGIVHRDLKPGNVMLTKDGAKLLDFGLAKTAAAGAAVPGLSMLPTTPAQLTAHGTILGTFQYMAPEQLEGREADARSDIFAFGALVFELVSGRKAFETKPRELDRCNPRARSAGVDIAAAAGTLVARSHRGAVSGQESRRSLADRKRAQPALAGLHDHNRSGRAVRVAAQPDRTMEIAGCQSSRGGRGDGG